MSTDEQREREGGDARLDGYGFTADEQIRLLSAKVERQRAALRAYDVAGKIPREHLRRAVVGALRSQIDAHGPVTKEWIGSAWKRIYGAVANATKQAPNSSENPETPETPETP